MSFALKEVILGASVPMENGSSVTLSVAGHIETERDIDDAVVIFGRKLLKYTNSASDADRLTVRQVVSSITATPLDKVPDVGTPTPPAPVKEPAKVAPPAPAPKKEPWEPKITKPSYDKMQEERKSAPTPPSRIPTAKEQAAAAVAACIKPPAPKPAPSAPQTAEASAPSAPEVKGSAPAAGYGICAECGEAVPASQAKLSQIFMSRTLCKGCMEAGQR